MIYKYFKSTKHAKWTELFLAYLGMLFSSLFEDENTEIEFFKSNLSGRWWMGVPFKKLESEDFDKYFVACSYADYEKANKGSVPSRWVKTYNRFL